MNTRVVRRISSKLLLLVAYFSVVSQYFWVLLLLLPWLISTGVLEYLSKPSNNIAPVFELPPIEPSPITWTIIAIIMITLLVTTIVAVARIPKAVLGTGETIVHKTTHIVIPRVIHHKKISKKRRRLLEHRFSLVVQLIATLIPLIASLFLPQTEGLDKQIVLIVSALLAVISLVAFVSSWLLRPNEPTSRTRSHASRG